MNVVELEVKIAEAIGYVWSCPHYTHEMRWEISLTRSASHYEPEDSEWAGPPPPIEECYKDTSAVPCFFNDLNAMAEAEKHLDDELDSQWQLELSWAVHKRDGYTSINMMRATAEQRATAFLRTLNHPQDTRES